MATRLYLRSTTANVGSHTASELSTTLPVGTLDDAALAAQDLSRSKGASEVSRQNASLAQTGQQSQYLGKHISEDLGAAGITAIAANTWNVRFRYNESSAFANSLLRVALYVVTSADAIRGYIYDGTADLGVEADGTGQELTVAGAAVSSIAAGDRLVCEVWIVATQGMASAYTNDVYYNGATDVVDATASDAASYVETPENLFPPTISAASVGDAGRDWDTPFQDLSITFTATMTKLGGSYGVGDTIPGLTVQINGGAGQAATYRSGEDTDTWVVRVAVLVHNGNTVVIDYARSTGELVSVSDSTELADTTDAAVTNNLTKRIRALLKDKNNAAITGAITLSVNVWGDDPGDANFMAQDGGEAPANYTPTGTGLLDVEYNGAIAVGSKVFIVVFYPRWDSGASSVPTEALVWEHVID